MKTTKTQAELIERARLCYGGKHVDCIGRRQVAAARALVEAGMAARFEDHSSTLPGHRYVHPITRRGAVSRDVRVYAGRLHFHQP